MLHWEAVKLELQGIPAGEIRKLSATVLFLRRNDRKLEALEGEAPDGVVVLEFPTEEDAKTWYFSPGYQAASAHRKKAAEYRVFMLAGV